MTYSTIAEMSESPGLLDRISGAAAEQEQTNARTWAEQHVWEIVASPGWAAAWESAEAAKTVNVNPDTGARDDVITDAMLLAAVQAALTEPEP